MRCTFRDKDGNVVAFCYQVGDGDIDHAYWNPPEIDDMFRRGWFATKHLPSTDCVSAAAASLAVNYFNFKDTDLNMPKKALTMQKHCLTLHKKMTKKLMQTVLKDIILLQNGRMTTAGLRMALPCNPG